MVNDDLTRNRSSKGKKEEDYTAYIRALKARMMDNFI